ncbi:MAG: hypothetical protein P4M09_16905 [Devosia sp.]|nr:hypothetical protein [Devosia sp.]
MRQKHEWDIDYAYRRRPREKTRPDEGEVIDLKPAKGGRYAPVAREKWTITKAFMRQMRSRDVSLLDKIGLAILFGFYTVAIYGAVLAAAFGVATFIQLAILRRPL